MHPPLGTLLSLAGVAPPQERPLDGVDLSPVLLGTGRLPGRLLYWASLSNSGVRFEAMREGPWKLVVEHPQARPGTFGNERVELYRLDRDPGVQDDHATRHPKRAAVMQKRLKAWYADTQRTATPQPGGWLSGEK